MEQLLENLEYMAQTKEKALGDSSAPAGSCEGHTGTLTLLEVTYPNLE